MSVEYAVLNDNNRKFRRGSSDPAYSVRVIGNDQAVLETDRLG